MQVTRLRITYGFGQHLLDNIFKIDQKSLSKRFITSQQTFTCSK